MSTAKKLSISDGLFQMGAPVAGNVAGIQVEPVRPLHFQEIVWDDEEEKKYRDWMHQQELRRDSAAAEWTEQAAEAAYRARLREQTAADAAEHPDVSWSDESEREFRRRYMQMRREQQQQQEEASWEELKAEEAYRERMRERDAANRSKKPIVWDDADERKCQQKYRKKYSAH